ncbi:MAG: MarR family winged helix-turn-helix transcriptional regulator [Burkholderiales bacterium]|nr:MarR family winged helix-turn-helix transcriptional regulator [Burkholderiales bacterium]
MKLTTVLAAAQLVNDTLRKETGARELSTTAVGAFLCVAMDEGTSMQGIEKSLGITQSAVSRNVQSLGGGRPDSPGAGLLTIEVNPYDQRQKIVKLSSHGRKVLGTIQRIIDGWRA